ncbi:hypothetical protein SNE40_000465 [Patella caerulea]|uniref:Epidermal growth factor-like protein 7 n=1 Tax=Patella caerulea TaxID=87958 RepID=A0AAN8QA09_PATCE
MDLPFLDIYLLVCFICGTLAEMKIHRPGRHICTQEKMVMRPVRRTETYCRPYYQRSYLPCPNDSSQLCSNFRLTYRTAQRTMFHMMPQREQSYSCCPGWSGYSYLYHGCLKPVCDKPCEHGGYCNQPGKCACPRGWNGTCCENDENECKGDHGCQQVCTNSPGGYNCSCFEGFTLQKDLKTCKFCLSCIEEYDIMTAENTRLKDVVKVLETEVSNLNRSMVSMTEKVKRLTYPGKPQPIISTTPDFTEREEIGVLSPEVEEMIVQLTRQVEKLENAVGRCYCESDITNLKTRVYTDFRAFQGNVERRLENLEFEQIDPPPVEVVRRKGRPKPKKLKTTTPKPAPPRTEKQTDFENLNEIFASIKAE